MTERARWAGAEARGLTTVVLGGQGGAGKTTLAIGLAAVLNHNYPGRVALVDLDLQYGDLAGQLGISPSLTWADLAAALAEGENLDTVGTVSRMPNLDGLHLLCAPLAAEQSAIVGAEHVRAVLAMLKPAFDHILVDAGGHFGDEVLEAVDLSDRVVVVGEPSPGSIAKTRIARALLSTFGVPVEKVLLAINRCDRPSPLSLEQVQSDLGWEASATIPDREGLAAIAVQDRVPIVDVEPGSDLTGSIAAIARQLCLLPARSAIQIQVDAAASGNRNLLRPTTGWSRELTKT